MSKIKTAAQIRELLAKTDNPKTQEDLLTVWG